MTHAALEMELRLRSRVVMVAAASIIAMCLTVGALFPALGHTFGKLNLPKGVADLLGGANYATLSGWLKSEIVSILGPVIVAGLAITSAAATTAGEEQDRITALLLAHPVPRWGLLLAKAAGIGAATTLLGIATFAGLLGGVAVGGGGISAGDIAAQAVHLVFLALALGALALAIGAATGERTLASAGAAAAAGLMFLVNGFAPAVQAIAWLKYLTVFHYYAGHDPLTRGVNLGDLIVLGALTAALVALAVIGFQRRDIRA
ncbi:MAG: beta-exotoxin transport system permease protein [Solirubrobacteraceae bacterium]|jgi:ABC-2 type transport system permease protein|nr:beta-exotoxin transport system permease protein [Solirubrobacteraceae bacterium]